MTNRGIIEPRFDPTGTIQKLTTTIDRLYRRGATRAMKRVLIKIHPADLVSVLDVLPDTHIGPVFSAIPDEELASEVLSQTGTRVRNCIVDEIPLEELVELFRKMPPDRLTDVIQQLEPNYASRLKDLLEVDTDHPVEILLTYPPHTAGGIMTTEYFALSEEVLVADAIDRVRENFDVEVFYYLYITDSTNHLLGVVSLRQLLLADPNANIGSVMNTRIVSVNTQAEEDQVAELVDKYQLLGMPVVDEDGVLVGMVTIDDVIEVIERLNTQKMLRMAGTDEAETRTQSVWKIAFIRLPWLAAAFFGGLVATSILNSFEFILTQVFALATFLPVIMGMAGNIGVQTSTVAVRSIAIGNLQLHSTWTEVFKELRVGLLLGLVYGGLISAYGFYFYSNLLLAEVVGITLILNMAGAALLGIFLPLLFNRMGADPAIATGPFVTTMIDILGVLNYLLISVLVFQISG